MSQDRFITIKVEKLLAKHIVDSLRLIKHHKYIQFKNVEAKVIRRRFSLIVKYHNASCILNLSNTGEGKNSLLNDSTDMTDTRKKIPLINCLLIKKQGESSEHPLSLRQSN